MKFQAPLCWQGDSHPPGTQRASWYWCGFLWGQLHTVLLPCYPHVFDQTYSIHEDKCAQKVLVAWRHLTPHQPSINRHWHPSRSLLYHIHQSLDLTSQDYAIWQNDRSITLLWIPHNKLWAVLWLGAHYLKRLVCCIYHEDSRKTVNRAMTSTCSSMCSVLSVSLNHVSMTPTLQ